MGEHQHRLNRQGTVGGGAGQDAEGERVRRERGIGQEVFVGGVETDVGDEAEVVVPLTGDPDELADADVFDGLVAVEAGAQAVDERALDDQPESVVSPEEAPPPAPSPLRWRGGAGMSVHQHQSTSARRIAVRRG